MVSIRQVARQAGVSTATVSHVVNATRRVRDETRRRVERAIEELGYRPNAIARSLTTRRTMTIGVLISNISNPFFADVTRGLESVLTGAGYSYFLCNTDGDSAKERHYLDLLLARRVDGVIAAPAAPSTGSETPWEHLVNEHVPLVFVDRTVPRLAAPAVVVDNEGGAYRGVRHLLQDGHRSIGILAGQLAMPSMAARLAGYRRALCDAGLPDEPRLVSPSPHTIDAGRHAALTLLSGASWPRALFCGNNLLAAGALQALRRLRLRCPADVALLAFDDHPWAGLTEPPLSVIRQPSEDLGRLAAERLLQLIAGAMPDPMPIVLQTELVVRQTCAPHDTAVDW